MNSKKGINQIVHIILIITLALPSIISIASATSGDEVTGVLYVDGEAVEDFFEVYPETTHSIIVCDLPSDIASGAVLIKVSDPDSDWQTVPVIENEGVKCTQPFDWTAPSAEEPISYVVQYRDSDLDPPKVFVAKGTIKNRGHIFVVPEFAYGTGASILAMLTSLFAFSIWKKHT